MQVWLFSGDDNVRALCADRNGAALPPEYGSWSCLRKVTLDHDDPDEERARALIREHGYCCFLADGNDLVSSAER